MTSPLPPLLCLVLATPLVSTAANPARLLNYRPDIPAMAPAVVYDGAVDPGVTLAADETSSTLVEFPAVAGDLDPAHYTMEFLPAKDSPFAFASSFVGTRNGGLLFRLTHPSQPSLPDDVSAGRTLQVSHAGDAGPLASIPVLVPAAPVLLVHGLWSNPGTFGQMAPALATTGNYAAVKLADYSTTNASSYETNKDVVRNEAILELLQLRGAHCSAGKVAVVGHSMGGVLARYAALQEDCPRLYERLITLNSPHSGTQVGDYLLASPPTPGAAFVRTLLNLVDDPTDEGAVADLECESAATDIALNGQQPAQLRQHFPIHAIETRVAPDEPPNGVKETGLRTLMNIAAYLDGYRGADITALWKAISRDLYAAEPHDLIVPHPSQLGGITTTSIIDRQVHSDSPSNPDVITRVGELLLAEAHDDATFDQVGFAAPDLDYTYVAPGGGSPPPMLAQQLAITAGENSGGIHVVLASPHVGILLGAYVVLSRQGDIVGSQYLSTLPWSGDFSLPGDYAGHVSVVATALYLDGYLTPASKQVSVGSGLQFADILATPPGLVMPLESTHPVSLRGHLVGGGEAAIEASLASFDSDTTSVASIPEPGVIRADGAGRAMVTIGYQGREALLPVFVLSAGAFTEAPTGVLERELGILGGLATPVPPGADVTLDSVLDVADIIAGQGD